MSSDEKFIQFPLCLLAQAKPQYDLLEEIIRYGFVSAGASAVRELSDEERKAKCKEYGMVQSMRSSWEMAARLGAETLGITIGSIGATVTSYHDSEKFHSEWVKRNGPDPMVRFNKAECFAVRDQRSLSLREFRVLAGIYSVLGRAMYRAITARMIRVRSLGFKSEAVEAAEFATMRVLPESLTDKQLRLTITSLHETRWFARVTPTRHGRVTYYSNRMTEEALVERIFKKKTYSRAHDEKRRIVTAALEKRIAEKKGDFNREPEKGDYKKPEAPQEPEKQGQREGDAGATEGRREGDYNRNPLNRNLLNRNPMNETPPPSGEDGYSFEGRFLTSETASRLMADNPSRADEVRKLFTPARRFTDGRVITCVKA